MNEPVSLHREHFFTTIVHLPEWKKSMAGKNEEKCLKVLNSLDYFENTDFVRQHPVGRRFVLDFAFVKERTAIEIDGESHDDPKQKKLDRKRDAYLHENGWVSIRIRDSALFGAKGSFYKSLIRETIEERRQQYQDGFLYPIAMNRFIEEDYD